MNGAKSNKESEAPEPAQNQLLMDCRTQYDQPLERWKASVKNNNFYSYLVLILLWLSSINNKQQRQSIGYAYGFKGDEFYSISAAFPEMQTYYGLFSGAAFTMTYGVMNIFAGNLTDKMDRSTLLGICIILWSLSTIFSGYTSSFAVLFFMRMMLGLL